MEFDEFREKYILRMNAIRKYDYYMADERLEDCKPKHKKPNYERNVCDH